MVDDEATARATLADILAEQGYAVETAADGNKALSKVWTFDPDVVLTDLDMPGMTGLELLRRMRDSNAGDTSVVVMSAFGAVETAVEAMKEGASQYLEKPLNTGELLLVLGRELDRQRLQREVEELRERVAARDAAGTSDPRLDSLRDRTLRHPEGARGVGGSTSKAAGMLGISVRKIQYKIHEYRRTESLRTYDLRRT